MKTFSGRWKMLEINRKEKFDDRVNLILDELLLGIRWERPSLIVVVYRSEYVKYTIQSLLSKPLGKSGQAVLHYSVDKSHYDIPLELLNHPGHKQAVFFVSGLRWGGGRGYSKAYRALNMHREYLVEGNIRAIFWLTRNEVKQLTRFSPDFWAFRHKVVDFYDLPSIRKNKLLEPFNNSLDLYTKDDQDFQVLINNARVYYAMGCIDEAIQDFRKALRKYPDQRAINLQIAEIYLYMGWLPAASRILKKAKKEENKNAEYLQELDRLNRVAASIPPTKGGFLEKPS
jgi:tetratricopeptide (TPR) repeat protein